MNKNLVIVISFIAIIGSTFCSENPDSNTLGNTEFYVASWNLENLFDTVDDYDKIDEWYLPESDINWTNEKLEKKLQNLTKVFTLMNSGKGPDILGVQEVEHKELLEMLLKKISINKNYQIVHYESPDKRGIDNAIIFNSDIFSLKHSEAIKIDLGGEKTTRDIIYGVLENNNSDYHVFVNHWPSRREGLKKSEPNRIKAAETVRNKIENLANTESKNIIILGDFNDLPSNLSISEILKAQKFICDSTVTNNNLFYNITYADFQKGKGTYKFRDHWNMLDQIIISKSLLDGNGMDYKCDSFEILKPDFIIQQTGKYKGTSLPTYGGRKYLGGYSDHFAIGAKFIKVKN